MIYRKKNILLVDRKGSLGSAHLSSMLVKQLCISSNCEITVLTDAHKDDQILEVYKKHNFKDFVTCFNYSIGFIFENLLLFIKSFYLLTKNLIILIIRDFEWFKFNFQVQGIKIGDLFHDTNNRYNLRFLEKKIDIYIINILFKTIFRTLKILKIIKEKNIDIIVSHHAGYAYNGSLSVRIGMKLGIKVMESKASNYVLWNEKKNANGFHNLIYSGINKDELKAYSKNLKEIKLNSFIRKRYQGKTSSNYTGPENLIFGNHNKKKISRKQLLDYCKVDNKSIDKIVLVAAHAFSDASHVLGSKFIFQDYYEHLNETLKFIKKECIENVLWVVRPHPSSKRYGELGIVENLVKKINYKFIKLCPNKTSTENLINICDNVITGRGTVGLEFASFGKYSLNSGSSAYSGLGVSLDFNNKKKYFLALKSIKDIPKLSKDETLLARSILHYLEVDSILWRDIMEYNKISKLFSKKNFLFHKSRLYKEINTKLYKRLIIDKII